MISQLAHAQVTLDHPTADVEKVVAALSQAAGEPHRAPGFDREFILVSVSDVPAEELRAKIAEVVGAEWRKDEQGWLLFRSRETERELLARDAEAVRPHLAEALGAYTAVPAEPDEEERRRILSLTAEPDPESNSRLFDMTPVVRTLTDIVRQIPIQDMFEIPLGERRVYSVRPTARQSRLPAICEAIMARGRREEAWLKQRIATPGNRAAALIGGELSHGEDWCLSARRRYDGSIDFQLYTLGEEFQMMTEMPWWFNLVPPDVRGLAPATPIAWTAGDKKALALTAALYGTGQNLEPLDPGTEPYSLVWETGLRALATSEKRQLIARIGYGQWTFVLVSMAQPENATLKGFEEALGPHLTREPNWLISTPNLSALSNPTEPDRAVVAEFLTEVRDGKVTYDRWFDWAARSGCRDGWNLLTFLAGRCQAFAPDMEVITERTEWPAARALGFLTGRQRQTLQSGGRLLAGQGPPSFRAALEDWVYGDAIGRIPEDEKLLDTSEVHLYDPAEPTAVFPRGLPSDGYLELTHSEVTKAKIRLRHSNGREFATLVAPQEFALYLESGNRYTVLGVYLVEEQRENYRYRAGPYYRGLRLSRVEEPENAAFLPYENLPPHFKNEVEEFRSQIRSGRNLNNPPPRRP